MVLTQFVVGRAISVNHGSCSWNPVRLGVLLAGTLFALTSCGGPDADQSEACSNKVGRERRESLEQVPRAARALLSDLESASEAQGLHKRLKLLQGTVRESALNQPRASARTAVQLKKLARRARATGIDNDSADALFRAASNMESAFSSGCI